MIDERREGTKGKGERWRKGSDGRERRGAKRRQ